MKTASVIITTKNRKEELLKAVESAMGQPGLLEVIVIDDGSTDGTAKELEKKFSVFSLQFPEEQSTTSDLPRITSGLPVLRLIRHEVSAGYIVRRNEGARLANGDVIFSLDDDAVFSSPFVVEQTLRDFSHPRIGAVAIPYIEPHKANREMQRAPTREDVWITASYIGTAHAVRRDVFLALGGYREHLVHQGEEGDFCIRMLAAKHEGEEILTTEDTESTEDEAVLTTIEHGSRCEKEQPQVGPEGKGVGATESKSTEGLAGPCLDKPSGAAFSNPSTRKFARDSENASLIRSADGPAGAPEPPMTDGEYLIAEGGAALQPSTNNGELEAENLPATSHSPLLIPLEAAVPGFFVRLGNSDPIIHNESPRRDYSRMDFYGRRNDVLFHWQNTPMPDLLWQLPMTIAGGLVCAAKVGRWRKMLEGIGAGFLAIAGGVKRKPVSGEIAQTFKTLKQRSQIYNLIVPSSF